MNKIEKIIGTGVIVLAGVILLGVGFIKAPEKTAVFGAEAAGITAKYVETKVASTTVPADDLKMVELYIPYETKDATGQTFTMKRKEVTNIFTLEKQKAALQKQIDALDDKINVINNL